jgi:enoyl-CoA hydratase
VTAKRIVFGLLDLEKPGHRQGERCGNGLGCDDRAVCGDVIDMAEHAVIGDPHVKAGVVAGDGGAIIWPQLIGYARAKEYLMTGTPSKHLKRFGWDGSTTSCRRTNSMRRSAGDGRAFSQRPRNAIRWTKTATNIGLKQLAHSILDASMAYETVTLHSATHKGSHRRLHREPRTATSGGL